MIVTVALIVLAVSALIFWIFRDVQAINHIPGPSRRMWFDPRRLRQRNDPRRLHLLMSELEKKYGPVINTSDGITSRVVVCDHESIYQVTVKKGRECGGRMTSFGIKESCGESGILLSYNPDNVWKTLRKVSQKHLRQFGQGVSRLESVISEVAEDMFGEFSMTDGKPFNPERVIFDTALNSIAFLITGERTRSGERLVEMMREYEDLFLKTTNAFSPLSFRLLNKFSWLKYFGFANWQPHQRFLYLGEQIWKKVKEMNDSNPSSESICKVLNEHNNERGGVLREIDMKATSLSLLFAGVTTTSATFYATINILAHHNEVQDKMYREVCSVRKDRSRVSLTDRPQMPYTRAVILEILRYTSVVARGVPHRAVKDTELSGYRIPEGTVIVTSLWNLHHNEEFWGNPSQFQPERFLDSSGDIVPPDHPNRTHLMPFGAGTRVCLGESLALARIFLWITTLVTRFKVSPATSNKPTSCDPRSYSFHAVFRPVPYEVIFSKRL